MKTINGVKLYTTREVATLLGVGIPTIANYRKQGNLKSTMLGGKIYISEKALEEYLNGEILQRKEEESKRNLNR